MQCGPTCVAMVLKYYGKEIPIKEITKGVGGVQKNIGVRCIKLSEYVKSFGFKTHCYSYNKEMSKGKAIIQKPSKEQILKFLKKGIPVIISVRSFLLYNKPYNKAGHYIIITNYKNGVFSYNDPYRYKRKEIKENDLLFAWYNNIVDSSGYLLAIGGRNEN